MKLGFLLTPATIVYKSSFTNTKQSQLTDFKCLCCLAKFIIIIMQNSAPILVPNVVSIRSNVSINMLYSKSCVRLYFRFLQTNLLRSIKIHKPSQLQSFTDLIIYETVSRLKWFNRNLDSILMFDNPKHCILVVCQMLPHKLQTGRLTDKTQ